MGCPPRVTDADLPCHRLRIQKLGQIVKLTHVAADLNLALLDHGDSGRVIAPVFELPQPLKNNRGRLTGPHVSDNTAHVVFPPVRSESDEARATNRFQPVRCQGPLRLPFVPLVTRRFCRCALFQEGKWRTMARPGRHPPIQLDLPPGRSSMAGVSPALQRGTSSSSTLPRTGGGGRVQALSSPSRSYVAVGSCRSITPLRLLGVPLGRDPTGSCGVLHGPRSES